MPVLTGVDVLGIQQYVFSSSRLRDVVSASWLVHWATARDGALRDSGGRVLQAGGGRALLLFPDRKQAFDFVARYTRRLYDEVPGLDVAVAHRSFQPGQLAGAMRELLLVDMEVMKVERTPSVPLLGLSVTVPCRVTGLPASGPDPEESRVPLSRMVLRWRETGVREPASRRWHEFLGSTSEYLFPARIDDMGRTYGDTSLIGVVHVDGNGLGEKIGAWLQDCIQLGRPDEAVCADLSEWTRAIDDLGHSALRAVVARVKAAITEEAGEPQLKGAVAHLAFALRRFGTRVLLPLRPILLGGDDLTFLCDGRVALALTEAALKAFEAEVPSLGRVTACAGVAIVPAHAPFAQAYALAEALCRHAKRRRQWEGDDGSWIDWHIGLPRAGDSIVDLRRRAYAQKLGDKVLDLTCRPYRLGSGPTDHETWRWLSETVLGTGQEGFRSEQWRQHRSKLKELASAVRRGQEGVRQARQGWTAAAALPWPGGLADTNGFLGGARTPLLDAVELLDLHLPLPEETGV